MLCNFGLKSNQTRAARSFDFEITRMISAQIALHSVQLTLSIVRTFSSMMYRKSLVQSRSVASSNAYLPKYFQSTRKHSCIFHKCLSRRLEFCTNWIWIFKKAEKHKQFKTKLKYIASPRNLYNNNNVQFVFFLATSCGRQSSATYKSNHENKTGH